MNHHPGNMSATSILAQIQFEAAVKRNFVIFAGDQESEEQAREIARIICLKAIAESRVATREAVPSPNAQSSDQGYQSGAMDRAGSSSLPPPTDGYGSVQPAPKAKDMQGTTNDRVFVNQNDRASGRTKRRRRYSDEEKAGVREMRQLGSCTTCKKKKKKCHRNHKLQQNVAGGNHSQGQTKSVAQGQSIRQVSLEPYEKQVDMPSSGSRVGPPYSQINFYPSTSAERAEANQYQNLQGTTSQPFTIGVNRPSQEICRSSSFPLSNLLPEHHLCSSSQFPSQECPQDHATRGNPYMRDQATGEGNLYLPDQARGNLYSSQGYGSIPQYHVNQSSTVEHTENLVSPNYSLEQGQLAYEDGPPQSPNSIVFEDIPQGGSYMCSGGYG